MFNLNLIGKKSLKPETVHLVNFIDAAMNKARGCDLGYPTTYKSSTQANTADYVLHIIDCDNGSIFGQFWVNIIIDELIDYSISRAIRLNEEITITDRRFNTWTIYSDGQLEYEKRSA